MARSADSASRSGAGTESQRKREDRGGFVAAGEALSRQGGVAGLRVHLRRPQRSPRRIVAGDAMARSADSALRSGWHGSQRSPRRIAAGDATARSADSASRSGAGTDRRGNGSELGDGESRVGATRRSTVAAYGSSFNAASREIAAGLQRRILQIWRQGVGLARIAGETGVARRLLSQRGKRYRDKWSRGAACPLAAVAEVATTNRGLDATAHSANLASRSGAGRDRRGNGSATAAFVAGETGVSSATVSRVLARHGGQRLRPMVRRSTLRYEKSRLGELLHMDLKYLPDLNNPRPAYEFAASDDYSREAVAQIIADRSSRMASNFVEQVPAQLPHRIEAVMTDDDVVPIMHFALHSGRQTRFQRACRSFGIEHRLIRPHTPASNGKVERLIKTIDGDYYAVHRPRRSKTRMGSWSNSRGITTMSGVISAWVASKGCKGGKPTLLKPECRKCLETLQVVPASLEHGAKPRGEGGRRVHATNGEA
jgi:transposase InsO family protein